MTDSFLNTLLLCEIPHLSLILKSDSYLSCSPSFYYFCCDRISSSFIVSFIRYSFQLFATILMTFYMHVPLS